MFSDCENFNQPLNSWDIDDSTNTASMFYECGIDEKNIPNFTQEQKNRAFIATYNIVF
nr:BspA family leucine-rich repeat surface protein [uncultured Campylobacter sp.]